MCELFFPPDRFDADGFCIRSYRPGDGAALQKAVVASYHHLKAWMPWANQDQTVPESEALVRRFAASYIRNEDYVMGIWREKELVGGTGFHLRWGPAEHGNAEIGMWIAGSEAGKGLGTAALKALLQWGFTDWPWQRIVWRCDPRNIASARVAQKCGLTLEGTLRSAMPDPQGIRRDQQLYAILRNEYSKQRRSPISIQLSEKRRPKASGDPRGRNNTANGL